MLLDWITQWVTCMSFASHWYQVIYIRLDDLDKIAMALSIDIQSLETVRFLNITQYNLENLENVVKK